MVEIKVNLNELAEEILNHGFSWDIDEFDIAIMEHNYEEYCEVIDQFIGPLTEEGYIISELVFEHLQEELAIIIKKKLYLRLRNMYNKFDTEDIEVEESEFRYFGAEKDI